MPCTDSTTARPQVNTRFFTRRVIFACGHTAERIYPIRDLRGPSFHAARPPVPMLLALRLSDKCIPCLREAVYSRCRDNAKEAREAMAALQARLDRILKKVDDQSRGGSGEEGETGDTEEADEVWPDQPPAVEALINGGADRSDGSSTTSTTSTSTTAKARPAGKLSENIRLLRRDLEHRMHAWSKPGSIPGAGSKAQTALSTSDLGETSSYDAFEAKDTLAV